MRLARDLKGIIPALEENTEVLLFEYPKDWRNEDYLILENGVCIASYGDGRWYNLKDRDEEYCEVCVERENGLLDRIGFAEYNKIVYD